MFWKRMVILANLVALVMLSAGPVHAQTGGRSDLQKRIEALEASMTVLERRMRKQANLIAELQRKLGLLNKSSILALSPYIKIETDTMNGLVGPHVIFTGVNVHVRSGRGSTYEGGDIRTGESGSPSGLGNLVLGYNESPHTLGFFLPITPRDRNGSHNLVIGGGHRYISSGGLLAGSLNEVEGLAATISGGKFNKAVGLASSVSGGAGNKGAGVFSSVTGGYQNEASGFAASASGGGGNRATGEESIVSGGTRNEAIGGRSSICGGVENKATGFASSVSGGLLNVASGTVSSVSGGKFRKAADKWNWSAGKLSENH